MNNLERKFTIYNFIKKSEIDVEDLLIGLNQQEAEKFKALIDNSLFKESIYIAVNSGIVIGDPPLRF